MMKFFAFVRKLFAVERTFQAVGQIAMDAINQYMIPQLNRKLREAKKSKDSDEVVRLTELIEDYAKYANPNASESAVFGEIAERVTTNYVNTWSGVPLDKEDLGQLLALGFYKPNVRRVKNEQGDYIELPSFTGKTLMDYLKEFDAENGVTDFKNFWGLIAYKRVRYMGRQIEQKNKDVFLKQVDTTEEGGTDGLDKFQSEGLNPSEQMQEEETQAQNRETMKRTRNYVKQHGDEVHLAMFDMISQLTESGSGRIDMKHDVYIPLIKKMRLKTNVIRMHDKMKQLQEMIRKSLRFDKSEGSEALKQQVKIGSSQFIYAEYRRRFAAWVLGE